MKLLPAAVPVLAVALLASCSDSTDVQGVDADASSTIRLDVRIHLLQSTTFPALNSTLTDGEVVTSLLEINKVWAQAGIEWRLESIVREPAINGEAYDRILTRQSPIDFNAVRDVMPRDNLTGAFDVFIIDDLAFIAAGVYFAILPAVLFAQNGPLGSQTPRGIGRRILAHELGHALGLFHVACTPQGNLMAPGCESADRERLDASQIETARSQAQTGRAFR